jgi:hypothetical protein
MFKKYPLAMASLIAGLLSFLQLFGLEKAVFAVVLGALALGQVVPGAEQGKRYAYIGIALGTLYIITLLLILAMKGPGIVSMLKRIG